MPAPPLAATERDLLPFLERASRWRQAIHREPELAYGEKATQRTILSALGELGIEGAPVAASTAVTAVLGRQAKGRCVGVRADMDGLPITEETGAAFASRNGAMHACGHDVHVSSLLGAAAYWKAHESDLRGPVKLLFQPAEEQGSRGGALPMIEAGVLTQAPPVDAVFALHLKNVLPIGAFGLRAGPAMAAPDHFHLKVVGKGGHAAYPHKALDPVLMASEVVVGLQALVSRFRDPLDPMVVSVCMIHGGAKDNILPDSVDLEGTVRTVRAATRDRAEQLFRQRVSAIVQSAGGQVEIEYNRGYPVTENPAAVAQIVERSFRYAFPPERVLHLQEPYMGGEDFSQFLLQRPGLYMFVGSADGGPGAEPMHSSKYLPDERVLLAAMAANVTGVRALHEAGALS